jgi:hypothetical protein
MTANSHSHLPKPEPYQRLGSGDGERKTLLTRQMPYEPLPASVLFALVLAVVVLMSSSVLVYKEQRSTPARMA